MLKKICENTAQYLWRKGSNNSNYNDIILLTGSPRSGTTWLLTLLETITKKNRRVWEPLWSIHELPNPGHPNRLKEIKNINFGLGQRPYIKFNEKNSKFKDFLDKLFLGNIDLPLYTMIGGGDFNEIKFLKMLPRFCSKNSIIKFCRAQRVLPFIQKNFPVKSILLLRHPLAVVASQLYHEAFQHNDIEKENPIISEEVERDYPNLTKYSRGLDTIEEKLAATWCFDYLIPINNWDKCDNTILVFYENLVENPREVLLKISDHYDVTFSKTIYKKINQPSSTTTKDSHVKKDKNPLTTWKKRLSIDQVNRIMAVVDNFGIEYYSKEIRPHIEELPI